MLEIDARSRREAAGAGLKSVLRGLSHFGAFPTLALWEYDDGDESVKGRRIASAREARARVAWAAEDARLDPALRAYLHGRQHDAWIRGFAREGDRFTVAADSVDLALLARSVLGAEGQEAAFPFDLVFEGVGYVGWRRPEHGGRLVFASAPRTPVEWLSDEFLDPEAPGVRWGLLFHRNGAGRGAGHGLLLVEAERLRVADRSREAWRARFGEAALAVYEDYAPRRAELSLTNGAEAGTYLEAAAQAYRDRDVP